MPFPKDRAKLNKHVLVGILGASVLILAGGGIFFLQKGENPPIEGSAIFAEYTSQTLEQYRGKPVIANSWAAWCPFCTKELADFAVLQKEFGDQIVILAINRQESASQIKKFVHGLDIGNDLVLLRDPNDVFYRETLKGFSMPETIFIDREGSVQFHKRGPMDKEEIRQRIEQIL